MAPIGDEGPEAENTTESGGYGSLHSLTALGPLSNSSRVAILAALLAFRRTTFTELMLAVNIPKSSLNMSLSILKDSNLISVRRGFMGMGGPRTIVEITPGGEKAIRAYLEAMRSLARELLSEEGGQKSQSSAHSQSGRYYSTQ